MFCHSFWLQWLGGWLVRWYHMLSIWNEKNMHIYWWVMCALTYFAHHSERGVSAEWVRAPGIWCRTLYLFWVVKFYFQKKYFIIYKNSSRHIVKRTRPLTPWRDTLTSHTIGWSNFFWKKIAYEKMVAKILDLFHWVDQLLALLSGGGGGRNQGQPKKNPPLTEKLKGTIGNFVHLMVHQCYKGQICHIFGGVSGAKKTSCKRF